MFLDTVLEFKVSFDLFTFQNASKIGITEQIVKFESIDPYILDITPFDIETPEIQISDTIYFSPIDFRRLIECPITDSHYLYDKNNNWTPFIEDINYDDVVKIQYLKRGLVATIDDFRNWARRYHEDSWHPLYELHHKLLLNPIIQQIYLSNLDSCYTFTIYKKDI